MYALNKENMHRAYPWFARLLLDEGYVVDAGGCETLRLPMPMSLMLARPTERCVGWTSQVNSPPHERFFAGLGLVKRHSKALRGIARALRDGQNSGAPEAAVMSDHYVCFQRGDAGQVSAAVTSRSPDFLLPAAAFSAALEFVAAAAGLKVGALWLTSMNVNVMTVFRDRLESMAAALEVAERPEVSDVVKVLGCPYGAAGLKPHPMVNMPINRWARELDLFVDCDDKAAQRFADPFFETVAEPLHRSAKHALNGQWQLARNAADQCAAEDWRAEAHAWIDGAQSAVTKGGSR